MEWEVWLADGRVINSTTHQWDDNWDGVLVVRWWGPNGHGINWGDGLYGHPATHKQAAMVSNEVFEAVLEDAYGHSNPPSKR